MVWKLIDTDSPGSESVYGGNDLKKINQYLNGYNLKLVDTTDGVEISTDTSFASESLRLKSPTTGFNYIFQGSEITADRVVTLPLMATDGTIALAASGTITDWGNFMQTFRHQNISFRNPADTFSYILNTSAITTSNRNITLPNLSADDTFVFANATQTLNNKTLASPTITTMTIETDSNIIKHSSTNNTGDLMVNNGTKFDRMARGTANQVPVMNATGTGIIWVDQSAITAGGGGGGEGSSTLPLVGNIIAGSWYGTAAAAGDGIWSSFLTNTSNVTPVDLTDSTGRMGLRYNCTVDDHKGGFRTTNIHFNRMNDPELWLRYKYDPLSASHGSSTNYRVVVGFTSDPSSSDYGSDGGLNNKSAFMWFKETADTVIQVGRNDGDSTQDKSSTVSLAQTDSSVHTIRVFGDNTNSRFGISLDNATATYYTTEIPAATTRLGCIIQFENEGSNSRSFEIYGAYFKAKVI